MTAKQEKQLFWRDDWRRLSGVKFGKNVFPAPCKVYRREMVARNEYWEARTKWERRDGGQWVCVESEKPIVWMRGMKAADAKRELCRMGADWRWL